MPLPTTEGLFFSPVYHLLHLSVLSFNPIGKSAFRDEYLPPYPPDAPVKAVVICPKDKRADSSFCKSWVTCGELADGDIIVHAYDRLI
jgi:hypothetical protein